MVSDHCFAIYQSAIKQMHRDFGLTPIKRYLQEHGDELRANGYFLSQGNSLKELKLYFVGDINVPKFTRQLGLFSFRAFLNIGMLLTESEKAKLLRTRILDIIRAIDDSSARVSE